MYQVFNVHVLKAKAGFIYLFGILNSFKKFDMPICFCSNFKVDIQIALRDRYTGGILRVQ